MPAHRFLVIIIAFLGLAAGCSPEPEEPYSGEPFPKRGSWLTSYREALEQARAEDRPVLVNFTGSDWCPSCLKQKEEVFSHDAFKAWAERHVVLLELDFPIGKDQSPAMEQQNAELQEKYGVTYGFPIVMVLDVSGEEPEVAARWNGYRSGMGVEDWIARAQAPVAEVTGQPEAVGAPAGG